MTYEWKALEVKIPGKDLLSGVQSDLDALVNYLELAKALLETVNTFLVDFGNPVRPLVEATLTLVKELFNSLKQTGLYGWFDIPNVLKDPNFDKYKGGYQALTNRFKASLFDGKDLSRPQPTANQTQSGFILIVADAEVIYDFINKVKTLSKFFGKELVSPQYTSPANVKAFLVGKNPKATGGTDFDPILQVGSVFSSTLKGVAVEWSHATNQFQTDPTFQDLLPTVSSEVLPQNWLIERTDVPEGPEYLSKEFETNFEDKNGIRIKRKIRLKDETGDYFRRFQDYFVISPQSETATYLLGQLGTFRFIDLTAVPGRTYHYRVRAFSGSLAINTNNTLNLKAPEFDSIGNQWIQRWPSSDINSPAIIGKPSAITTIKYPKLSDIPVDFDVITVMEYTFRMAFALGFHLELGIASTFDTNGYATNDTPYSEVGVGSLKNLGSPLAQVIPAVTLGFINPKANSLSANLGGAEFSGEDLTKLKPDPTSKEYPDVTHNYLSVKLQAARLAASIGSSLLQNDAMLLPLKTLYSKVLPRKVVQEGNFKGVVTLKDLVYAFNKFPEGNQYQKFPEIYDANVYITYHAAYTDQNTRLNLLDGVLFLKSFATGGTAPDWVSINILQDIVPWSGAMVYDLLSRLEALADAFKSGVSEIKSFVTSITRTIDSLERFLKFLTEILNFLDSFSAGFYILNVGSTDKGIPGWIEAIDQATGTKPSSGPGGYSAGIALAYAGTDVSTFLKAFSLIF